MSFEMVVVEWLRVKFFATNQLQKTSQGKGQFKIQ